MTAHLTWKIEQADSVTRVILTGSVDEDADFTSLTAELQSHPRLRFDLGGIARVNSCGVREWVNFVRSLPPASHLELENCAPVVVSQLNMINNFAGSAKVLSLHAPFVCEACGREESVLVNVESGSIPNLEGVKCSACGQVMQFDDVEDSYFAFLS